MKKIFYGLIFLLVIILIITGCAQKTDEKQEEKTEQTESVETVTPTPPLENSDNEQVTSENEQVKINRNIKYSPFTGEIMADLDYTRALMVSIENSPQARPQAGLKQASIVYEFLVEGGITRFLALYWDQIPDKVGPVRSVRPYLIETALDYNALILHAGASPGGFALLETSGISHLDQIYHGNYYWRDGKRRPPHNLYTGYLKIKDYLNKMTGHDYPPRFSYQQIRFIEDKDRANEITVDYWGTYKVIYLYNQENNYYRRFLDNLETPHVTEEGDQLTARNIIVQFVSTGVKDDVGRLRMNLEGSGRSLIFRDGIVINGSWKSEGDDWTHYFNGEGEEVKLNPGQTWIQIVPESTPVTFKGDGGNKDEPEDEERINQ